MTNKELRIILEQYPDEAKIHIPVHNSYGGLAYFESPNSEDIFIQNRDRMNYEGWGTSDRSNDIDKGVKHILIADSEFVREI